jgi:serine/threonine protein kinase
MHNIDIVKKWCHNLNLEFIRFLGSGDYGNVYEISSNKVIKITSDIDEVICAYNLMNVHADYCVNIYDIKSLKNNQFAILMEKVSTKDVEKAYDDILRFTNYNTKLHILDLKKADIKKLSQESIKMIFDIQNAVKEINNSGYNCKYSLDIKGDNIGINKSGNFCLFDQKDKNLNTLFLNQKQII